MIKNIISGACIGVANIIPGVSGGTVALLLGVYEKLTESVGEFLTASMEKKKEYIKFLSQIFVGAVIGLLGFAKIIGYLYANHEEATSFFFLGLIVASLPLVLNHRENKVVNNSGKVWFLIGLLIMIGFSVLQHFYGSSESGVTSYTMNTSYAIKLILAGSLAGGAMVIPGISGSLLLVMLGEYYNILGFVNDRMIVPISLVGIGAVLGIVGFARIIDKLLKSHKDNTLYFIIGLIVASLLEIWPGFTLDLSNGILNIISIILGVFVVQLMKKLEGKK